MSQQKEKNRLYYRRKHKTNTRAKKSSREYRCVVYRSNLHIYVQAIAKDGRIVAAQSDKRLKLTTGTKVEKAREVGRAFAKELLAKNITSIVFDRNGYLYHGRVAALAEGMREGGIKF